MRIITELKEILYAKGLTLKFVAQELEKRLNKPYTLANLSNKLRNETITYREMKLIAEIIGSNLELKQKIDTFFKSADFIYVVCSLYIS